MSLAVAITKTPGWGRDFSNSEGDVAVLSRSFLGVLGWVGLSMGVFLVGLFSDWGFLLLFLFGSLICVLGALVYFACFCS